MSEIPEYEDISCSYKSGFLNNSKSEKTKNKILKYLSEMKVLVINDQYFILEMLKEIIESVNIN